MGEYRRYVAGYVCTCGKIWPEMAPFLPFLSAPSICPVCGEVIENMERRAILEIRWKTKSRFFRIETEHVRWEVGRKINKKKKINEIDQ